MPWSTVHLAARALHHHPAGALHKSDCMWAAEPKPEAGPGKEPIGEAEEGQEEDAPVALAPLDQDVPVDGGPAWAPLSSSARPEMQHQARLHWEQGTTDVRVARAQPPLCHTPTH